MPACLACKKPQEQLPENQTTCLLRPINKKVPPQRDLQIILIHSITDVLLHHHPSACLKDLSVPAYSQLPIL
jgi:hypothetical protein